jgi:hypothetical protein
VPPERIREAVAIITEHRAPGAGPFDVAVSQSGIPSDDEMAAYAEAGATWVMATGWIEQLPELIELAGTRVT